MDSKIVLNDGTEITGGSISRSEVNQILVSVPGDNLVENAILFNNSEKTLEMSCYYSIYKETYHGYTTIDSIAVSAFDHTVQIYMSGENASFEKELTVPEQYAPWAVDTEVNEDAGEVHDSTEN